MKNYRNSLFFIIAMCASAVALSQQKPARLELNYSAGIPAGNFRNQIENVSPRGAEASLLFSISDQLSLGLQTGFQDFYQKYPRQVFEESGYALSAVVTNSVQVIPLMFKARYHFNRTNAVQPYASLAAGANLITYGKYYGEFVDGNTKLGFAAQPELGIHIPLGAAKRSAFNLGAGYHIMPYKFNDADGLHHINVKAGLSFSLR